MWSCGIVEAADVSGNLGSGLGDIGIGPQISLLIFDGPPELFDEDAVPPGAFPIHVDADLIVNQQSVKALLVNWEPRWVFKISRLPCRASASSTASKQNACSSVIYGFHDRILQLNQSKSAVRQTKPRAIGI
jgi:hypothetical protein